MAFLPPCRRHACVVQRPSFIWRPFDNLM
jgi:hypothetical protein